MSGNELGKRKKEKKRARTTAENAIRTQRPFTFFASSNREMEEKKGEKFFLPKERGSLGQGRKEGPKR